MEGTTNDRLSWAHGSAHGKARFFFFFFSFLQFDLTMFSGSLHYRKKYISINCHCITSDLLSSRSNTSRGVKVKFSETQSGSGTRGRGARPLANTLTCSLRTRKRLLSGHSLLTNCIQVKSQHLKTRQNVLGAVSRLGRPDVHCESKEKKER